jgi:TRAP-type C4-dicarboxylate transport system permease small subunit
VHWSVFKGWQLSRVIGFGKNLSGLLLAIFFVFVATDVFTRNVIKVPIIWLNEGSVFSFQWMTFFAGAICFYEGLHFKVSILTQHIEEEYKVALTIIEIVASSIFGVVLLVQGIQLTILNLKSFSPALGICMAWILIALPISAVGIILSVIGKTLSFIKDLKGGETR